MSRIEVLGQLKTQPKILSPVSQRNKETKRHLTLALSASMVFVQSFQHLHKKEVLLLLILQTLTLRPWQQYKVASMSQRNIFKETHWHLTLANNKIFQGFQYVKTYWWTRSAAVARITDTDTLALATIQGCLQSAFCCSSVFKCTFYWFAMFGCKQYHQYCLKIWSIVKSLSSFLK